MEEIKARHIQVADNTSRLVPHWGYVDRVLPCTNDAGSCEYLDAVYWMHDVSMLYTFILWTVIGGLLALFVLLRFIKPSPKCSTECQDAELQSTQGSPKGWYYRAWRGTQANMRKYLLPESFSSFFRHVTRLQILTLSILLGYLLVFSLIGIVYKTWITPVKNSSLYNTRTGLGGFADRIGALAYALTPLTIALSTRESILSLATGIPYQSFNFLHRWLGRVIFVQSFLHTLGWTLIEGRFYNPQPTTYLEFIKEPYIIWGIVAMTFITFLYIFSIRRVINWTGYEFFRKSHYVIAVLYIGACWGHWEQLKCWMIASLGLWLLDRVIRLVRTWLLHTGLVNGYIGFSFQAAQASIQYIPDADNGIVRLDFEHEHGAWAVGQHFYLCFPAVSIWQSHPMTVASVPSSESKLQPHSYIIRCRKGETKLLKELALNGVTSTSVILCGPYGKGLSARKNGITNVLAVAGGTGVTLILPVVMAAMKENVGAAIDFVWIARRKENLKWLEAELDLLHKRSKEKRINLKIHIYITQQSNSEADVPIEKGPVLDEKAISMDGDSKKNVRCGLDITILDNQRPVLKEILEVFMQSRASDQYRTKVVASGPAAMGRDLREAVAGCNDGGAVWSGRNRGDVELVWDCRDG